MMMNRFGRAQRQPVLKLKSQRVTTVPTAQAVPTALLAWFLRFLPVLICGILATACSAPAAPTITDAAVLTDAVLTARAAATSPAENPPAVASPTAQPSATILPTATPSPEPSATPTLAPTATTPPTPPTETATPLPTLAVVEGGFTVWCAPLKYAGAFKPGVEAPQGAESLKEVNGQRFLPTMQVLIPAEFCTLVYTLNQPPQVDLEVQIFDGNAAPFLKAKLTPVEGSPEKLFVGVNHPYVVNPPFWEVTYRIDLVGPDGAVLTGAVLTGVLRSDMVRFAKTLPSQCPYGGLPDPVTLYCAHSDPWEVEPHPGIVYPYPTFTPGPSE